MPSEFKQHVGAFLLALASLAANSETAPAPYFFMGNWTQPIGQIPIGFADPSELAGEIARRYAVVPWTVWVKCGQNLCPRSFNCSASAEPTFENEFLERLPPTITSRETSPPKPITYTTGQCTAWDSVEHDVCVGAGCVPSPPGQYWMMAYCGNDLVFREHPARCECSDPARTWNSTTQTCLLVRDRIWDLPKACPAYGNPIYPLTGIKRQEVLVDASLAGFPLNVIFNNRYWISGSTASPRRTLQAPSSFGAVWSSSMHQRLIEQSAGIALGMAHSSVAVLRSGAWETFGTTGGLRYLSTLEQGNELTLRYPNWYLADKDNGQLEVYDFSGRLTEIARADGPRIRMSYSDASTPLSVAPAAGHLITVTDAFGRQIGFEYGTSDTPPFGVRVKRILRPDGASTEFGYDLRDNLKVPRWPDGTAKTLLYEDVALPWALTGMLDELGHRTAAYAYDGAGRVVETSGPGSIARYSVHHATPPQWEVSETYVPEQGIIWRDHRWRPASGTVVTGPLGSQSTVETALVAGMPRLAAQDQLAGSGCAASIQTQQFDERGNVVVRTDFNGVSTCMSYDSMNRETTRIEGVLGPVCAGLVGAGAPLPVGSRKVSTQWHPDWRLPSRVAEPGRVTSKIYNGQPDSFTAGGLASCAPPTALLPDGKPIAVICRQVEQATTDPDGALGFSASLEPGVPAREQRWTYNAFGQVLTHDGPRTDVADLTRYAYYGTTSFSGVGPDAAGYTVGDLLQVTNPAGHITRYTLYNKVGRLLEMVDPNGVTTRYTHDLGQRLTSIAVGDRTTTLAYWPTGLVQRITQADGSWLNYEHDDAHRLWRVSDNQGNSVTYTLDGLGNRTEENFRDPGQVLRRALLRSIDALGRVQQVTGGEGRP